MQPPSVQSQSQKTPEQKALDDAVAKVQAFLDRQDKDKLVFLRADKTVPYGEVMEVMNTLRVAGYLKVSLVTLEKLSAP